jgi:indoleamine 2,3-dioxygenase
MILVHYSPSYFAGSEQLRKVVKDLPLLDTAGLSSPPELERAMLVLGYIANAYVWCDADGAGNSPGIVQSLPACVAVPYYQVAKRLGRLPALSLASVSQNWRLVDESKPLELGNIVMNQNFYVSVDEEWFFLIPTVTESKGEIMQSIVLAQQAVNSNSEKDVISHLTKLSDCISEISNITQRMRERCNPTVFFMRIRPFVHGWGSLPNGLLFEGVDEMKEPVKYAGTSAAQTPLLQIIDAALEIKHSQPFLVEMRKYMQQQHVKFIEEVEKYSTIRQYVQQRNNPDLLGIFNTCVDKVAKFRSYHIQLATSYILSQSSAAAQGSGGSSFVPFLKANRDNTLSHSIKDGAEPTKK